MEWVEVTADTIEDAKESALDHLGVDESLAEFEIVTEPKRGFLGRFGNVDARVRARVRPTQPRPKNDRRRRRSGASDGGGRSNGGRGGRNKGRSGRKDASSRSTNASKSGGKGASRQGGERGDGGANPKKRSKSEPQDAVPNAAEKQPARSNAEKAAPAPSASESRDTGTRSPSADSSVPADAVAPDAAAPRGTSTTSAGDGRKRRGSSTRTASTASKSAAATAGAGAAGVLADATPSKPSNEGGPGSAALPTDKSTATGEAMQEDVTVEEQADIVWGFLEGLLDAFDVDGEITQTTIDEDTVELSVLGDDLGLLIGPKGNTLQAIQELSRTAVQRQVVSAPGRVRLDIAQYRQKRREALARFVTAQAEQIREAGVQRALEPMNAADRKVVHDTVNEIDGMHTISEGQDPNRRVVIIPDGD